MEAENFEKKLNSIQIHHDPVQRYRVDREKFNKLKKISEKKNKIISEQFAIYKKKLNDVIEFCENNKFVPEELPEDDDIKYDDDIKDNDKPSNTLHHKIGIVQMIEEKSQT